MSNSAMRILLVEDNAAYARLISEQLNETPGQFDVTHAAFMSEAINLVKRERFDAMLLDLSLPDSQGLASIERAAAEGPDLPIIILTNLDDENAAKESLRKGAQDYLVKGRDDGALLTRAICYALERKRIEAELKGLNETLERRVAERTAAAEMQAARSRALAVELTRAEQRERRRLAEILHDHLQQLLVAAKFSLDEVRATTKCAPILEAVQRADDLISESIDASRSLTVELIPPALHDRGLEAALTWLGAWMKEKHGLEVAVTIKGEPVPLSEDVAGSLFHVVRELLFNVVKHAKVKRARVEVTREGANGVRIIVADEGVGFDPARAEVPVGPSSGVGLSTMRERLSLIGGRMHIVSAPGQGCRVTLLAPIRF